MKYQRLIIGVLSLLLLLPTSALAQDHSRISFGVGGGTVPDWLDLVSNALLTVGTVGKYKTEVKSEPVAVLIQYDRFVTDRISLLGAVGGQSISRNLLSGSEVRGDMKSTYGHLMAGASFHYLRGEVIGLYSSLAGGLAVNWDEANYVDEPSTSDTRALPAFQITPIGMRVGKSVGAFLELGFGYRGMAILGLSYDF